ncbi:unnamed protein product [[Actinomadura] parvosata subsp. kistnae]|nr:unnamed protein product [Actinomadura parvosata subsp. kistnae]
MTGSSVVRSGLMPVPEGAGRGGAAAGAVLGVSVRDDML